MRILVTVLGLAVMSGCNDLKSQERYQLASSSDGKVYRLDKTTGEVALVTPEGVRIVGAANDPLGILGDSKPVGKKIKIGRFEVQEIKK